MRIVPPVPLIERIVTSDLQLDDTYTLPVGTEVGVAIYQLHQHPLHFPNPAVFDPTRFTAENSKSRHPYAYVPFSAGMRNCIGQKFAMLELKIMCAHVLRSFHLHTDQTLKDTDHDLIFITRPRNGIWMTMQKRQTAV